MGDGEVKVCVPDVGLGGGLVSCGRVARTLPGGDQRRDTHGVGCGRVVVGVPCPAVDARVGIKVMQVGSGTQILGLYAATSVATGSPDRYAFTLSSRVLFKGVGGVTTTLYTYSTALAGKRIAIRCHSGTLSFLVDGTRRLLGCRRGGRSGWLRQ